MQSLNELLKIAERPVQGPSPTFERAHLLLAFLTIGESGVIGRLALAGRSGLGEGSVRTVLKKLREDGYAKVNASGCFLTPQGKRVYDSLSAKLSSMVSLGGSKLTVGASQVGLVVRGRGKAVRNGIEQRDSAIKLNAEGATTYVFRGGKFTVPGGLSDCEKDYPSGAWVTLRNQFKPKNGDAIILCGARDELNAKLGALSSALTLL